MSLFANVNFLKEFGSLEARRLIEPRALHLNSNPKKCAGYAPFGYIGNNGFFQGESKS